MTFPWYLSFYCRRCTVITACPWVKPFCFRRLSIRTTTLSLCVELFLGNYHIVHCWCSCDGLAWWRPPKGKRCCWSMLDNNDDTTTMNNMMIVNEDEDLCVLENAKGAVLTSNILGGPRSDASMPCCYLIWRWFFSFTQASESEGDIEIVLLGILYLREYRSDWVLVNEGGCLSSRMQPIVKLP